MLQRHVESGIVSVSKDQRLVPLFACGDHDLGHIDHIHRELPAARVTPFHVDDCWHCHFVANTRVRLWDEVARWLRALP